MENETYETLFPELENNNDVKKPTFNKTKRGMGYRPLLESEIKDAQNRANSASEAARILGVSYNTYRKYATLYGIFDRVKNQAGIGLKKGSNHLGETKSLDELLEGRDPNYAPWKLKKRLISHGYIEEKCSNCGFDEKRVIDFKVPLVLDFIDGDRHNFNFHNLRFLCLNCSFLINGNLTGPKPKYEF